MEVREVTKNNNGHLGVVSEMFSMGHEKVLICQDSSVGLKAIIAVHSTVCGPSLGGLASKGVLAQKSAKSTTKSPSESIVSCR